MSEVISAEPRTEFGKGPSRRARKAGRVPGVLYGHGTQPRHISLPGHDLMLALRHGGANTVLELDLGSGDRELALAKSVTRDPIKGFLEHVDLLVVKRGEKVLVDIPVVVTGEAPREGVVETVLLSVPVEAEATHIPERIEVDTTGFEVGHSVHAGELALPSGVTLTGDPEAVVVSVVAPSRIEEPAAEGEAAEGTDEVAEGETAEGGEAAAAEGDASA